MKRNRPRREWIWRGAIVLGVVAAAAMGVSAWMLSRWSDLRSVTAEEAESEFAGSLARAGGGPPYVEILPGETVRVRRELEAPRPRRLAALHLVAWEPDKGTLLRMELPFWFVRMKMTDTLNLGTLTAFLAHDWKHLDLKVTEDDLERRGAGLVLDHRMASGARVLIWTSAADGG